MKRILYVGMVGELEYADITIPRLEAYAEECEAEFKIIDHCRYDIDPRWLLYEALHRYVEEPDGTHAVIADADLLVLDPVLNAFGWAPTPNSVFGQGFMQLPNHRQGHMHTLRLMGYYHEPDMGPLLNTGLVSMTQEMARRILDELDPDINQPCDQTLLNAMLSVMDVRVRYFPEFLIGFSSRQRWRTKSDKPMSAIVHHNAKGKIEAMKDMLELYEKTGPADWSQVGYWC